MRIFFKTWHHLEQIHPQSSYERGTWVLWFPCQQCKHYFGQAVNRCSCHYISWGQQQQMRWKNIQARILLFMSMLGQFTQTDAIEDNYLVCELSQKTTWDLIWATDHISFIIWEKCTILSILLMTSFVILSFVIQCLTWPQSHMCPFPHTHIHTAVYNSPGPFLMPIKSQLPNIKIYDCRATRKYICAYQPYL